MAPIELGRSDCSIKDFQRCEALRTGLNNRWTRANSTALAVGGRTSLSIHLTSASKELPPATMRRVDASRTDSAAPSRVSLIVVALGSMCMCANSFVLPSRPLISGRTRIRASAFARASPQPPKQSTRMMAGDPDVSLILLMSTNGEFVE